MYFKSTMRKISLYTVLIFFAFCINAQVPQTKFNYLTTDEGLSTNRITCFYRDSKEWLWIGTEAGLNKYDGYQIKAYQNIEKQPGTLSNNSIECIYEDQGKNIWCGTFDG